MKVAARLSQLRPSATLEASARAAALRAKGVDVISLTAGEPDFDTPDHIKEAAKRALDQGQTKYTAVAGTLDLRRAVAEDLRMAHGLAFAPDQIIVSTGAKNSLFNLFQVLLEEGDEVILPAPYWVSYPDLVRLAGGVPRILEMHAADGYVPTADALSAMVGPRTRALVLNSPGNPTGAVISRRALEALAEIVLARDLVVVSDDIYRQLIYTDEPFCEIATLGEEIAARTFVVDGLSKTYAMTGWRVGFCAGSREIIAGMTVIQGQTTSNPTSISQAAALAALTGPQECVQIMRRELDRRRRVMVEGLRAIPGVLLVEPHGAFYAFPDIRGFLGRHTPEGRLISDDIRLTEYLLEHAHVACVPGEGFGATGHVRFSYTASINQIEEALRRVRRALEVLK